jgi:hypothetical protein
MNLNVTEFDDLNDGVEDVGTVDEAGVFTPSAIKEKAPLGSRVPQPRITTMAYKNRGSLANNVNPPPPARKVTYDDILSSLNMQVVNGKLQITRNVVAESIKTNNFNPDSVSQQTKKIIQPQHQQQQQGLRQNNRFDQMRQQQQMFQQQQQMFQHQQQQQNPSVPIMSKEQYKQMVAANYLKALEQQQRIKNMKSTKMMFSNSSIGISPISGNNSGGNMNRLFRFGK